VARRQKSLATLI